MMNIPNTIYIEGVDAQAFADAFTEWGKHSSWQALPLLRVRDIALKVYVITLWCQPSYLIVTVTAETESEACEVAVRTALENGWTEQELASAYNLTFEIVECDIRHSNSRIILKEDHC